MIEEFIWDAKAGKLELDDGSTVSVQAGDVLLGIEDEDGVTFLTHERPKPN